MLLRSTKFLVILGLFISLSFAKKPLEKSTGQENDKIDVIGHLVFDGASVTGVLAAEHWRRDYLYLSSDGKITVVDVTNGAKPKIDTDYRFALPAAAGEPRAIVGNTALLVDGQQSSTTTPSSVSILSFADPRKPELVRQFNGITGFLIDSRRALIYIVNHEGLWILNEKPARDLELEKEYEHQVIYNR